jgi:hypothetical protein
LLRVHRQASRAIALVSASFVLVLGAAACGGSGAKAVSATDATSGLTITVAGDAVTVKRSAASSTGTGGGAAQIACTDDYRQLATATAEPAPTVVWYAATLITWPQQNASSTATLSHALANKPDLCIAEMSDQSAQAVVYFRPGVKNAIEKTQQESQASAVLQAVSQTATQHVTKGALPSVAVLTKALQTAGMYVTKTAKVSGVTDPGALYIITSETTSKHVVAAILDNTGTVQTVTQGVKGSPKLAKIKK